MMMMMTMHGDLSFYILLVSFFTLVKSCIFFRSFIRYTTEPSEAEKEAMENEIEQAKGGGGGGGTRLGSSDDPNVNVLVTAVKAQAGDNWNLKSTTGMRSASIMVAKILLDHHPASGSNTNNEDGSFKTIDLPRDDAEKDYKNAKLKVAEVVQMNREKTIDEMIPLLIGTFGYVEDKKKKASVKQDKLAETVAVPANAPIVAALQELAELYFKEGNRNAGGSYVKAVKALSELDYVITKENALQLGKGKTKVSGIGKGTAEKIFEFYNTGGEIAKLQEKRGDAA
jgi:Helix-hairpin-helix domain